MQWQWLAADSSSSPPSFLPPHSPLYTCYPTRRRVRAAVELGGLSGQMDSRAALFCFLAVASSLLHPARSDGEDNQLLKGINSYRASLKVPALTENSNADCLAEQLAKKFKGQECTNTTGANTVPGTEPQFPDYPQFLDRCHLNASVTEDGQVMPACVPGLVADIVLTNYTKSQHNRFLNDTKYSGIGIANEGDWVVVVLSTSTDSGDYSPAPPGSNWAPSVQPFSWMIVSLVGFVVLLMK